MYATPQDRGNAEGLFDKALKLDPGFSAKIRTAKVIDYLARGETAAREHDVERARENYERAKKLGIPPERERLFQINVCQWGSITKDKEEVKEALPFCDAVIDQEVKDIGSLFNRAVARARIGDNEGALEDWNSFKKQDKNFLQVLMQGVPPDELQKLRARAYQRHRAYDQFQAGQQFPGGAAQ